jgi:uncharacterized protein DUF4126
VTPPELSTLDLVLAGAAGVAIAAACGLRAFLPLLALGLGVHFHLLRVDDSAAWIGWPPAIVALLWATILELAADKVPALDHLLDLIGTALRPAAAAVAGWCTFTGVHPALGIAAALLLGAGAMGVHVAKAKVRLGSSMLTFGTANPLLSFLEDAIAIGLAAMAILAPLAAVMGVVLVVWAFRRAFRGPRRPAIVTTRARE